VIGRRESRASGGASLTDRLVDELTRAIDEGRLGPGQRLPTENQLIEQHEVSRTVVREAVARLRASGLVESQQGRGSFVLSRPSESRFTFGPGTPQTLPELIELIEFRTGIESETAALAAVRRSGADLDRLQRAHEEVYEQIEIPARSIEADFRFHLAVARAGRNRHYVDLMTALGPVAIVVPRARRGAHRSPAARADGSAAPHGDVLRTEHGAVLGAIHRGDAQAAAAAMRVHLAASAERVRRETTDPER
jgi:GntR family transcriptional regulator, transcriptional repressor for pyruvate dehydrogenase complex